MKNFLTAAAAAAAAVTLTAASAWAGTINQGDRVRNQEWDTCTVGYVQTGSAYTAGHCGKTGDTMFNFQTNEQIGTLNSHYSYPGGEDWAEITLNDTTTAGENTYSGNQVVSPEDIEVGDTIHSYGGKTGQQYTGTVTRTDGHQVLATGEAGGLPGDSGGPAWIDGKGLVGVYSSYYTDGAPEDKYAVGFHPVVPEGAPRYEAAPEEVPEENPVPAPDVDHGDAEAESGDTAPAPEESLDTDKPETDKPETESPVVDQPETDKPETEKAEPKPETEKPETESPVVDQPETDKSETEKEEAEDSAEGGVHYEEAPLGSEDAYIEVKDFDDTALHGARGEVETTESDAASETTLDNEAETSIDNSAENTPNNTTDTAPEYTVEDTQDTAAAGQNEGNESRTLASTGVGNWVVPVSILAIILIIAGGVVVFRNRKK